MAERKESGQRHKFGIHDERPFERRERELAEAKREIDRLQFRCSALEATNGRKLR